MTTIAIPDEVYHALVALADERQLSPDQMLAALVAQERWEEHAANAYDAYHARTDGSQEALTEEEFFESLREAPTSAPGSADANL